MSLEYATRGLVGALTPQANTTVEPEFSILWPAGVAMINARLTSPKDALEDRLVEYFERLEDTAAQFANAPVGVIAVACTGASYLAGVERERDRLRRMEDARGVPVFTAASAVVDALRTLGAERVGLVSPYPATLTQSSVAYWETQGFRVGAVASAATDARQFHPIYSIPAQGAAEALEALDGKALDAIVMLGTGMPTLRPILDRPQVGGVPVMSCMLCLAWRAVVALDKQSPSPETLRAWIAGKDWGQRLIARG